MNTSSGYFAWTSLKCSFFNTLKYLTKNWIREKLNQNNEKSLFHVESICFSSSSQLNYSLQNYASSKETKWKLAFTLPTDVLLNWIRFFFLSFMCYQALCWFALKYFPRKLPNSVSQEIIWRKRNQYFCIPFSILFFYSNDMMSIIQHNWSLIHIITEYKKNQFAQKIKFMAFKLMCNFLKINAFLISLHNHCHNFVPHKWCEGEKASVQIFIYFVFHSYIFIGLNNAMTHFSVLYAKIIMSSMREIKSFFLIYYFLSDINYASLIVAI